MSSYWNSKRVFVTGATGLLGSWLVKSLVAQGAFVVALVRDMDPQSEFFRSGLYKSTSIVNGELQDYDTLERTISEQEVDTVFHLAAQPIVTTALRSPLMTFEANIRGTYNLLEACRVHKDMLKRVVIASSDKAYGDTEILPYTEEMPPLGRHPYDVSKSCADLLSHTYYNTYDLPVAVTRCGNIYGGGDLNWNRIIPGTILSLYKGKQPVIRSDGRFTRDYIYVQDVVDAYLTISQALDKKEYHGQAFNVAPEKPKTVLEVVDALRKLMSREDLEPVILNQAKGEIRDQYLCCEKAKTMLNWKPRFSLEQGLSDTVNWYIKYLQGCK